MAYNLAFTQNKPAEYLRYARDIGARDSSMRLEMDLEMLEAIIKLEVDRAVAGILNDSETRNDGE